jgi:hypothetical protein
VWGVVMAKREHAAVIGRLATGIAAAFVCIGTFACDSAGEMAILDVNPRVGATQGDQPVHIIGKHFRQDIGYTVYFGTKKTGSVTIRDPETIEVMTPNGMPEGKVDIMIRADDGNAFRITDAFTFQNMGGTNAVGGGVPGGPAKEDKGNLAY